LHFKNIWNYRDVQNFVLPIVDKNSLAQRIILLKQLKNRFRNSEFLINVSKLTSGTAIAQLISIGTAPVLYRTYEREHYGTLGMYMAITGILGVFSTLQYLQVIMLEKEDDDAINAMWLNRIINTSFALLVAVSLLVFSPLFAKWADNAALSRWFWMIPIGIFFAGQNEIFRLWANRKKEYNLLTFNAIFLAVLTPIISITLGLWIKNETGLFVGLLVGQSLPALILLIGLAKKYDLGLKKMDISVVKQLFKMHAKFPIYSLPSEFVNRFSNQLPVFMLNHFVGLGAVGGYNLAMRMLGLPIGFIGEAISNVFRQRATEDYHRTGSCRGVFIKTFKSLALISIVPTIVILLFGPDLFQWAFGHNWRESGVYSQILIVMMMLKLIVSPLSYTFFIVEKLQLDFIFHLGILATTALSLYLGLAFFDLKTGLLLFCISYSFWYLNYLFMGYKFSSNAKIQIN
jgi:O-antigen/teichoic acid export membrane protein